jgi:uncharacterized protein (DUF305 family)
MNNIPTTLAVALMIVTGVLGAAIGYGFTPEYSATMYDKTTMDLGRPDRTLDLRYVNAMIAHHRGAMLLAQQASSTTQRQEMRDLSAMILKDEPPAIEELYEFKKAWYNDTRAVRDPIVSNLGDFDDKFDLRFLNALIAHHEAGLLMTREISTKSSRTEVLNNADAVDAFLKKTLPLFIEWRANWYNIQ